MKLVFIFLARSFEQIGETADEAADRAVARLREIEPDLQRLGSAPHQCTLWPESRVGLRWVTKRRAIFYFLVDDAAQRISVLAVFYGGEDHRRVVLECLVGPA